MSMQMQKHLHHATLPARRRGFLHACCHVVDDRGKLDPATGEVAGKGPTLLAEAFRLRAAPVRLVVPSTALPAIALRQRGCLHIVITRQTYKSAMEATPRAGSFICYSAWRTGCDKAVLASPAIAVARDTAHCRVCCRSVRPVTASSGITHALGWTCSACGRTGCDDTQRYVCEGASCGRTVCAGCFSGGSSGGSSNNDPSSNISNNNSSNSDNNNSNSSNSTAAGGPAVLRGTAAYVAMGQRADKFADLLANRLALHVIRRGVARDKHNCAALMGVASNLRRFAADAVRRGLFIDNPSHATQTSNLLNMAAFQTMSGELLRKKGSYLFGDPVENKVVRSGKVAGVVATHGTRLKQHHVGSKAQSSVFYQMYPDASVLVREIVWLCGGAVSERASGCVSASSVVKGDRPHRVQSGCVRCGLCSV
jgi:hypothetical protein